MGFFSLKLVLNLIYTRFQRICPFSFSFDSFILLNYLHSISPVHFMVGATDYHHVKTTPFLWLVKIDYIHHISKFVFRNFLPNGFWFFVYFCVELVIVMQAISMPLAWGFNKARLKPWHSRLKRSTTMRKFGCSNPSHDRPKSQNR